MKISKPSLSFWQIFNMNVGFLGIQYSFGLQQTAINPIFLYLGASEDMLPILNIAGPVTGLIVQPIIGALSDKTWSLKWGRRKPYFLIGALLGSICLFMFPHSPVLWFAVGFSLTFGPTAGNIGIIGNFDHMFLLNVGIDCCYPLSTAKTLPGILFACFQMSKHFGKYFFPRHLVF